MSILFNEIADSIYICAREHIEGGEQWNRLEQAEQAAPPAARRGAERDRGIAFVRAAAPRCRRGSGCRQ